MREIVKKKTPDKQTRRHPKKNKNKKKAHTNQSHKKKPRPRLQRGHATLATIGPPKPPTPPWFVEENPAPRLSPPSHLHKFHATATTAAAAVTTAATLSTVNAKADIDLQLADFDRRLANVGCTITSDGWDDAARHPLLNFLATAPDGVKFLDAVDTSGDVKDAVYISGKLLLAMDIVGRDNVVQVMTDGASACVAAGELVMQRWVASQHVLTPECCGWLFAVVCRCQPCSR